MRRANPDPHIPCQNRVNRSRSSCLETISAQNRIFHQPVKMGKKYVAVALMEGKGSTLLADLIVRLDDLIHKRPPSAFHSQ